MTQTDLFSQLLHVLVRTAAAVAILITLTGLAPDKGGRDSV